MASTTNSFGPASRRGSREAIDIEAKYEVEKYPHITLEQRRAMLQQLLAERFKLVVHHEQKEFPLYALTIAKDGPKFYIEETKPRGRTRPVPLTDLCARFYVQDGPDRNEGLLHATAGAESYWLDPRRSGAHDRGPYRPNRALQHFAELVAGYHASAKLTRCGSRSIDFYRGAAATGVDIETREGPPRHNCY